MAKLNTSIRKYISCTVAGAAALLMLTSCELHRDVINKDISTDVSKPQMPKSSDLINSPHKPPIVDVPISASAFLPTPIEQSEPLPDIEIESFNAADASVFHAFKLLLQGTGIAVTIDPAVNQTLRINAIDLSGSLRDVLDTISESTGLFYTYRRGNLQISSEKSFVVRLPPLGNGYDDIADMIGSMGAGDVAVNAASRSISFRTGRDRFDSIRSYLLDIKKSKVLIVYETYFFEVLLSDELNIGIDWNSFTADIGNNLDITLGGGTDPATIAGINLGVAYTSGDLSLDSVVAFLQQQGNLQIISKPVLSLVSGNTSTFEVGGKIRFVSEIGTTSSDSTSTTTVNTEELDTGLQLTLTGDYQDSSVYTDITLNITNFLDFDEVPVDTTTLNLPRTTDRSLQTTVRSRPGDMILLAGINETRDEINDDGVPGVGSFLSMPTNKQRIASRSELVMILEPRVLRFVDEDVYDKVQERKEKILKEQAEQPSQPQETPSVDLEKLFLKEDIYAEEEDVSSPADQSKKTAK